MSAFEFARPKEHHCTDNAKSTRTIPRHKILVVYKLAKLFQPSGAIDCFEYDFGDSFWASRKIAEFLR